MQGVREGRLQQRGLIPPVGCQIRREGAGDEAAVRRRWDVVSGVACLFIIRPVRRAPAICRLVCWRRRGKRTFEGLRRHRSPAKTPRAIVQELCVVGVVVVTIAWPRHKEGTCWCGVEDVTRVVA